MHKGIKILAKVLSTIALLLIFLPVAITLVLNVEPVQNLVVRKALHYASGHLGTDVYVEGIDFDLFSKVRVRGLYVEDYNKDTLLYVPHASVAVEGLNIAKDGLRLSGAKLYGAKLYLRELPSGELNIKPLLEQLKSSDGGGDFRLYIDDVDAGELSLCYEKLEYGEPRHGVDFGNVRVEEMDAHLTNFAVVNGAVWTDIERLSFSERSGFELEELTSHLYINQGEVALDGLNIKSENSLLYLSKLNLKAEDWSLYKDFVRSVEIEGRVDHSELAVEDVAYFVPVLEGRSLILKNLSATVEGTLSGLDAKIKSVRLGDDTELSLSCRIAGLPNWRSSRYVVGVEYLYSTSEDVIAIAERVSLEPLSAKVLDIVESVSWVEVRGTLGGVLDNFRLVGDIQSGAGDLAGDVIIAKGRDNRLNISGQVQSDDLSVGEFVALDKLYAVTSDIKFNGSVGGADTGGVIGDVEVKVSDIKYGSYNFTNIQGEGSVSGRDCYATINSDDPNLKFELRTDIRLDEKEPSYVASASIQRADMHALGINRRDSVSVLSANIGIDLQGDLTEGINGYVSVADVEYEYPKGRIATDRVKIEFADELEYKSILLDSDFLTLDYSSNSSYLEAYDYIYNALRHYMPLLYNDGVEENKSYNTANDYAALTVNAGEHINELLSAVVDGLFIAPNTAFDIRLNPKDNAVSIRGESEAVEYSGVILGYLECDVNNSRERDSMVVALDSKCVYMGANPLMPNFSINGGVSNNMVDLSIGYSDNEGGNAALLALKAELQRNMESKSRRVMVDVEPSYFHNMEQRWELSSRGILIEPSRISVDEFTVARPEQRLVIDGVLSSSLRDSVYLTLDNFDISGLSLLIKKSGFAVEGVSNGYATVRSALESPKVEAAIALDSLEVNDIKVAPQFITSNWDIANNRAHLVVSDRVLDEVVVEGYYQPTDGRYSADANIRNADMILLKPYIGSVLSDIEGTADYNVHIEGDASSAVLSGDILVKAFGATVDYTKVRYTAPSVKFKVEQNHIITSRTPLYDADGNMGYLSLDVDLNNLRNVSYSVAAEVNDMLSLNITPKDNDTFYGRVYATGEATFKGDRMGTKMNIDITSADNSRFYLPLQRKEDVSYASFVTFVEPDIEKIDTVDFLMRRMMANQRHIREIDPTSKLMDININANVLPNMETQLVIDPTMGDVIKAKGEGELSIHIVPEANIFDMHGDIKISEGTYLFTLQNILNKLFTVVPGSSIHWDGDPKAATLNLDAVYSTKASLSPLIGNSVQGFDTSHAVPVDCYIKLTDELTSPTVTFDVKVPNVAPEIQTIVQSALNDQHAIATQMFWLLAANSFSAEDTGAMGASLSATTGFELLSNQVSNWLSGDDYNIILRYRPRTELAGDEVDFGFSKSWFNNRLIVELEGGYLSEASAQAMQKASNFVGEAFITWLIDPEGVLRFRGFTQTIDRYGENQGMQESGVGLYYNESFNTFAELKQSLKKRFGSKDNLISPFVNASKRTRKEDVPHVTVENKTTNNALDIVEPDTLQTKNNIIK